jgi:hypothetical protein
MQLKSVLFCRKYGPVKNPRGIKIDEKKKKNALQSSQ